MGEPWSLARLLFCPVCETRLRVPDLLPRRFPCPRCASKFDVDPGTGKLTHSAVEPPPTAGSVSPGMIAPPVIPQRPESVRRPAAPPPIVESPRSQLEPQRRPAPAPTAPAGHAFEDLTSLQDSEAPGELPPTVGPGWSGAGPRRGATASGAVGWSQPLNAEFQGFVLLDDTDSI